MRRLTNIIYKILKEKRDYETPTELLNTTINSFRERKKLEEEKLKKKQELKEHKKYREKEKPLKKMIKILIEKENSYNI